MKTTHSTVVWFRGALALVMNALKRDGETQPVRKEMAEELRKHADSLLDELEKTVQKAQYLEMELDKERTKNIQLLKEFDKKEGN